MTTDRPHSRSASFVPATLVWEKVPQAYAITSTFTA
jgi:hypothetical protein